MNHEEVVIVSAVRTAIGCFKGMYKNVPAHRLGETVIRALLTRTNLEGEDISEVILGQIMTAGAGPNPARQAAINAGLPIKVPAWGMNQLCGSGLRTICSGLQAIRNGDAEIVIAGGQENMTRSPHLLPMRSLWDDGTSRFVDTMLQDALIDPFHQINTVGTAENIARKYGICREEQDFFAAASQRKCQNARNECKFIDEIVPIVIDGKVLDSDETPRNNVTLNTLSRLKPSALRDGTVTPGNASGISDAAAGVVLMSAKEADKRGLTPMATIRSWAQVGVEPATMGTGPIPACNKALKNAGWDIDDLDLIESNESFASQAIYVDREMHWDTTRVNVNGGAIALGHPFGASGARILTTLLHEMPRQKAKKAIATLCVGGGMGVAMCLERN
jgi:acetyl-CoA C-acetyltransferase